jgi:transposase
VVDLESDLILAADIRPATDGDAQTLADSMMLAQQNLNAIESGKQISEVAADKGYHSADALELCRHLNVRTYIPEPKRTNDWTWTDKSPEHERALRGNRKRMRREKGKQLQRARSELCERTFAHVCESGGMRRTWLTGLVETTKRYLVATAAHNLGRVLRKLFGVGKPRGLQGGAGDFSALGALWVRLWRLVESLVIEILAARRAHSEESSRPAAAPAMAG